MSVSQSFSSTISFSDYIAASFTIQETLSIYASLPWAEEKLTISASLSIVSSQSFSASVALSDALTVSLLIRASVSESLTLSSGLSVSVIVRASVSESLTVTSSLSTQVLQGFLARLDMSDAVYAVVGTGLYLSETLVLSSSMGYKMTSPAAVSEELRILASLSSSVSAPSPVKGVISYVLQVLKSPWTWIAVVIALILIAASAKPRRRE